MDAQKPWRSHPSFTVERLLILFLALLGSACTATIGNPQPPVAVPPEPAAEVSRAVVPISVPLASIRQLIDDAVPMSFGEARYNLNDCGSNGCGPDAPACRWNAGYGVGRTPMTLDGSGQTLTATTQANYWLAARVRIPCPGPLITVGCGDEHNAADRRHLNLRMNATVRITDNWDTAVTDVGSAVQATDDCKVGPFGVANVTDKITEAVRNRLNSIGGQLDTQFRSATKLRERMSQAWAAASRPIPVLPDVWLVLAPEALEASQPAVSGGNVTMRAGIRMRPKVTIGAKPEPPVPPLPNRQDPQPPNTFVVSVPAEISFDAARQQLRRALRLDTGGVRVPPSGKYFIRPTDVDVQGYGKRVVVAIPVTGKVPGLFGAKTLTGTAYLLGTPVYNSSTGVLSFPDLDFTAETNSALISVASFFKHEDWRDQLRGQLRLDIKQQVQDARTAMLKALNASYGPVRLAGGIDQFELQGIWSDSQRQVIRAFARAAGTLSVNID